MVPDKAAFLVKRNCQRTVACSDLKNGKSVAIVPYKEIYQYFSIGFSLKPRQNGNTLDFKNAVPFISYQAFSLNSVVFQNKQLSSVQILFDHLYLLICKQHQVYQFPSVSEVFPDFHFSYPRESVLYHYDGGHRIRCDGCRREISEDRLPYKHHQVSLQSGFCKVCFRSGCLLFHLQRTSMS